MQPNFNQALGKAKIKLLATPDTAFFSTILFSLKQVFDERIPTLCTDGREIRINPEFFMTLSDDERVSALVHETMHVAYLHVGTTRQGSRDPRRFNVAADYVINLQLHERGFKIGAGWLLDAQYAGMSTEQVYDLLPPDPPPPPMEDLMPGPGTEGAGNSGEIQREIEDILVRARIASKMANDKPGTIPGEIEIFLNGLLEPKLPWNRVLQKYLNAYAKNDYSFRKPNRRFFPKHYLPSLYGQNLCNLAIAVDTSGSVSDHDFHVFVSEVASILRMMKPEKISLIQFDTAIKSIDEIKDINDLRRCKFTGRGGTLIKPVLTWAEEQQPQVLLVFSDGEFHQYETTRKGDTLWVIHNNERFDPPFGKVIHYSI